MASHGDSARARRLVLAAVALTVISYQIPYAAYVVHPMMLLSTYAHEMGHGLAAAVTGGAFRSFVMHADGSGAAQVAVHEGISQAVVAAGGLVGPAVLGALMFVASARSRLARVALVAFALAVALSLLLVVRNLFGWVFLSMVLIGAVYVAARGSALLAQCVLAFLAAQLAASVFARSEYLFSSTATTAEGVMPSDVAQIAEVLWLPYWFWGAMCGLVCVAVLVGGLTLFWRATVEPGASRGLAS